MQSTSGALTSCRKEVSLRSLARSQRRKLLLKGIQVFFFFEQKITRFEDEKNRPFFLLCLFFFSLFRKRRLFLFSLQDAFRGRRLDVGTIVLFLSLSLPAAAGGMEKHGREST